MAFQKQAVKTPTGIGDIVITLKDSPAHTANGQQVAAGQAGAYNVTVL
jgi:hypothetical protein